ncbi:MAG: S46 family peptidase [Taibaiella sp.]|nr:S46 family peptidase [Taibaiella sp.]
MFSIKNRCRLLLNLIICSVAILQPARSLAKEGMWIPATLKNHEKPMKEMGLELPIDKLYNESGTGLNNAVVLFGKGCTGEVISSQGLILTNHHCGYGTVQGLSNVQNDYFANGFFAQNQAGELPCPGLTVTFVRRMENVTEKILPGISDTLRDAERDSLIATRIKGVEKEFEIKTGYDATIKPYFEGNQYWVAITETFRDIRLVCFPPNGIGTFGGDDENWVWPRHTGDFSVFRVYAGAENKPAAYAATNKPYAANQFFNISTRGYKEGDFSMVYGFPGTTMEYISSFELNQVYAINDPISIAARTKKLATWSKHMDASRDIFLKYTSKRAGVANGWKKWQGEIEGLRINNAPDKKRAQEKVFAAWAALPSTNPVYRTILPRLEAEAKEVDNLIYQDQHIKEEVLGIELIQQGSMVERLAASFRLGFSDSALRDTLTKQINAMSWFYKNYDLETDKDVFKSLMPIYFKHCKKDLPDFYWHDYKAHRRSYRRWARLTYQRSLLTSKEKLLAFAAGAQTTDSSVLLNDPAWKLYNAVATHRKQNLTPRIEAYRASKHYLNRLYIKAQMERESDKLFFPDANLTLRLSYGDIKGLDPDGPAGYSYLTTLGEVIALDDTSKAQFKVPAKLKELYGSRNFGRWSIGDTTVPVAFIAVNHTSGGNSGSPVLNGRGELIGTNFDRAYEGTMSDYLFDPNRCRNISVDIRYTLFIIEKFGGAGWLVNEMNLVN